MVALVVIYGAAASGRGRLLAWPGVSNWLISDGFIHWIGEADLTQFAKSNILNLKTLILNIALAFNHGRPCLHTHHPGSSNKYHRSAYPCPD